MCLGLLVIVGWIVGNDGGVGKVLFAVGWICAGLGAVVGLALWRYERAAATDLRLGTTTTGSRLGPWRATKWHHAERATRLPRPLQAREQSRRGPTHQCSRGRTAPARPAYPTCGLLSRRSASARRTKSAPTDEIQHSERFRSSAPLIPHARNNDTTVKARLQILPSPAPFDDASGKLEY